MRDYKGIHLSKGHKNEGDNLAPEVNRIWDALEPIDAFLRDMSSGMGRITRGQNPDSSGDPLGGPTLDDYFFLPGRIGNQLGYGGTLAAGTLTLSSTSHSTKGNIFFGAAENSAYDETNDRFGIGITAPDARLHIDGAITPLQATSDLSSSGWQIIGSPSTHWQSVLTADDATHYTSKIISVAESQTFVLGFPTIPSGVTTWRINFRARKTGTLSGNDKYFVSFRVVNSAGLFGDSPSLDCEEEFTTSWADYSTTVTISAVPAGTANSVQVSYNSAATAVGNRWDITYLDIEPVSAGGGDQDLTLWSVGGAVANRVDSVGQFGIGTGDTGTLAHPLTIGDSTDRTKRVGLDLTGITTATTHTWTAPDDEGTVVLCNETELSGGAVHYKFDATAVNPKHIAIKSHIHFEAAGSTNEIFFWAPTVSAARNHAIPDAEGIGLVWTYNTNAQQPAAGSLVYGGGANAAMAALAIGAAGTILSSTGAAPQWSTNAAIVDIVRTWTTLQTFPDNTFKIVGSADATKTLLFELDGASPNADARILFTSAVDADFTLPPTTTTLAGLAIQQTFTQQQIFQTADSEISVIIKEATGGFADIFAVRDVSDNPILQISNGGTATITAYGGAFPLNLADNAASSDVTFDVSLAGAGSVVVIPPGGGTMVTGASGTLFTNKDLGTACYVRCGTASTNARFGNGSSEVQYLRLNLTDLATGTTTVPVLQVSNYSGRVPVIGTDPPAVATEALGAIDLITQSANIGTTNLTNAPVTGIYRVDAILMTTTGAGAGGTLALTVGWTDNAGATTTNIIAAHSLVAAGRSTGSQLLRVNSGEITYAVAVTGIYSTAIYAVYVRVTYMG